MSTSVRNIRHHITKASVGSAEMCQVLEVGTHKKTTLACPNKCKSYERKIPWHIPFEQQLSFKMIDSTTHAEEQTDYVIIIDILRKIIKTDTKVVE